MMKSKAIKMDEVSVPLEVAETCYERVKHLLQKYHNHQILRSNDLSELHQLKKFGLKELIISCYTQGLVDGQQLKKH